MYSLSLSLISTGTDVSSDLKELFGISNKRLQADFIQQLKPFLTAKVKISQLFRKEMIRLHTLLSEKGTAAETVIQWKLRLDDGQTKRLTLAADDGETKYYEFEAEGTTTETNWAKAEAIFKLMRQVGIPVHSI